ncbi:sulfite exporter TauE/SafE family protein [Methylonatrum kenyense]|uniref:sulfite exporter TauE/SafE family protein n=1 Tax=Methylonatrum kenyense TaxID=455253 RepID=UPI0020BED21F|nr:sulfite exporter TauE/SafE family protein [Methylonatrum kenyense]MCK8516890.1 sulfite exporter TauE/SafE family protein [Methylonatrum kenyense]
MDWIPAELGLLSVLVLLASSLLTSMLSAAFGLGGGVALLAMMTLFLPIATVIPLHGVIQAGSNLSRLALLLQHVDWRSVIAFAVGTLLGTFAASLVLIELPEGLPELILGLFIVWSLSGLQPRLAAGQQRLSLALGGIGTGFATLFVGATGPLVAVVLRILQLQRHRHVATFAACMVLQHLTKIVAFAMLGFSLAPWLPFLAGMLAAGLIGTWLGRHILDRLDESVFRYGLGGILALLAARLIYQGIQGLVGHG